MLIDDFKLERYFAKYEFSTKYLISSSDCDGFSLEYILSSADDKEMSLWNNLRFGYTDSRGSEFLRESIASQYKTLDLNNVLVMSPGEANFILMNTILNKGDEIICMYPSYQSLYQVAVSLGAVVKWWKFDSHQNYQVQELESLLSKKTKLLVLNFPHNPTGFLPSVDDLNKIISLARKYNLLIFSDEMYHQLVHDASKQIPSICDLYENSVCLWGMAKSFGLAGLRFGWVTSHRADILKKMVSFKDYLSICNNAAGEVLTYIALNHKDNFINHNIKKIVKNKKLFSEFVRRNSDLIEFVEPVAGSTALAKLNIDCPSLDYCEKLVSKTGIMMVPGEMFDYGDSYVRIGFGRENFDEVLKIWESYINEKKP
ncbi:MAG TPA: aminotransferase class I/II-fold pyridoxal phosphate-dependent enzyme [Bacteroidales bacterium]|nr:aminotransferase class I/II-fold pyridoxal phosphate-dependent enzyme [Bacteroidales bacterium]